MNVRSIALIAATVVVSACTTTLGDKTAESRLKRLEPVPGKVSLYVCRPAGPVTTAGLVVIPIVDGQSIGAMGRSQFAHAVVEPGAHEVYLERKEVGITTKSGKLAVNGKAGEVVFVWVGITGAGFGSVTVDNFPNRAEAEACVRDGGYVVRS